jgi:hypothetical protein
LQKSALMTAQRDLYLGNSPSSFDPIYEFA